MNFKIKIMKGLITLLLFAISVTSYAQSTAGAVKGTVRDEAGAIVEFASVLVEMGATKHSAYTDVNGKFMIKPLNPGTYVATVRYEGKHDYQIQFNITSDRITFLDSITLTPKDSILKVFTLEAKDPLINKDDPNKITLGRKEVLASAALRDMSLMITSMDSGIKQGANGELYFRGGRSGAVVTFVDGVKVGNTVANLPGRAIGSVSVYTGGVPAKYGDTTSGVVVLETVSYFELYYSRNQ